MKSDILTHTEGVSYSTHPAFIADLDSWSQVSASVEFDPTRHYCATGRPHRFETSEELVSFVERNKHQIIVYAAGPRETHFVLWCAKKPGATML